MTALAKPMARTITFDAHWIEWAEYKAAAMKIVVAAGDDPEVGANNLMDYLPPENHPPRVSTFQTLKGATKHLQFITANGRDLFGQASIYEVESVPHRERCRYCSCNGNRILRTHTVEPDGIVETTERDSDCWDGEDV